MVGNTLQVFLDLFQLESFTLIPKISLLIHPTALNKTNNKIWILHKHNLYAFIPSIWIDNLRSMAFVLQD